jgi:predicted nucleic acid-binding protein
VYLLDSNVYIEALRDPGFGDVLAAWEQRVLPRLWLSSVVVLEILLGARDAKTAAAYERLLLAPFRRRRRLLEIDLGIWRQAAIVLRKLAAVHRYANKLTQRRFLCDVLIAVSCRRVGATLVTANVEDFALISEVMSIRLRHDFPEP